MTNWASKQIPLPSMVTELTIKHYETHTTTRIHGETMPTVILARSLQDQPSPSKLDRMSSTTPGAEPPRDTRDSGSARSHSTHLETSSSD